MSRTRWSLVVCSVALSACHEASDERHAVAHARQAVVGPEFPANPQGQGPQGENAFGPALGWLGPNFLVAWLDVRLGTPSVYVSRMTTSGALLDGRGFQAWPTAAAQSSPQLACARDTCLLTWVEWGATSSSRFGLRLGGDGRPIEAAPFVIPGPQEFGGLASNGTDYAMVWRDPARGLVVTRFSGQGQRLDTPSLVVVPSATGVGGITSYEGDYLLAYETSTGVYGVRFRADGGVGVPFPVSAASGTAPVPAALGAQTLFAWEDWSTTGAIRAAGFGSDGGRLPAELFVNGTSPTAIEPYGVAMASVPEGFWLAWQYATGRSLVSGVRISAQGVLLDPTALTFDDPLGGSGWDPVVLCPADAGCFAAWDHGDTTDYRVHLSRLQWDAGAVDRPNLRVPADEAALANQQGQRVACAGDLCLVTWLENRGAAGLRAARVSLDAGVLDPTGLTVTSAVLASQDTTVVVPTAVGFVVVWSQSAFTRGATVGFDGTVSPADAPLLDGGFYTMRPSAGAATERVYLASVGTPPGDPLKLYSVALDGGLHTTFERQLAAPFLVGAGNPVFVSTNPTPVLCGWWGGNGVAYTRLDPTGASMEQPPAFIDGGRFGPVSADPDGWLLFEPPPSALVRRVFADAGLGPAVALDVPDDVTDLAVGFDGVSHVLTWTRPSGSQRDVFVEYVGGDGRSLGPATRLGVATPPMAPVVAGAGPGRALLAYTRYDPTPGVISQRVFLRWLDHLDAGSVVDGGVDAGDDGGTDAGADRDGGASADGGPSDGGTADGGPGDGGAPAPFDYRVGCGCDGLAPLASPLLLALLALGRLGRARS